MIEISVPDITCNHCAQAITEAVKDVDAQAVVNVDVREKRVSIESARDRKQLEAAIRDAGYSPA